jgi:hypothetical protein
MASPTKVTEKRRLNKRLKLLKNRNKKIRRQFRKANAAK